MASLDELKEALLQTLAAKGSLGQMKARIRAEIFKALDGADDAAAARPPLSNTNLLINELIREYLAFNQYRYSLGVFLPETNQPETPPFDRQFISRDLHIQENQHSVQIPLLYSIVALLQQGKVADSTAGVSMEPQHEVNPLDAFAHQQRQQQQQQQQAAAGQGQESLQQQPQRSQQQAARPAFGAEMDAPRPLQFTNRQ